MMAMTRPEVVFGFVWFILIRVGFGWVINARCEVGVGVGRDSIGCVCLARFSIQLGSLNARFFFLFLCFFL
jgi:hypothetical protein